jgi:hypothetical protein
LNPRGGKSEEMDDFAEVDEQNVFGKLSDTVTGGKLSSTRISMCVHVEICSYRWILSR